MMLTCLSCKAEFSSHEEHRCDAGDSYRRRSDEQLAQWLEGDPRHNDVDEECCPDFSCCQPDLLAPRETREAFARADAAAREGMLMGFLGALAANVPARVHVAGDPTNYEEPS